jgi:hypothetical protein
VILDHILIGENGSVTIKFLNGLIFKTSSGIIDTSSFEGYYVRFGGKIINNILTMCMILEYDNPYTSDGSSSLFVFEIPWLSSYEVEGNETITSIKSFDITEYDLNAIEIQDIMMGLETNTLLLLLKSTGYSDSKVNFIVLTINKNLSEITNITTKVPTTFTTYFATWLKMFKTSDTKIAVSA